MQEPQNPILRDFLIRFQQTAIKETGRRPMTYSRGAVDEKLSLPGCARPGYMFWQPIPWKDNKPPLGKRAGEFHGSIISYLSLCQFLEIRFRLPVAPQSGPLGFLFGRVFETCKNTESHTPAMAFSEAFAASRSDKSLPVCYTMAATCDGGEAITMLLGAADGQMILMRVERDAQLIGCKMTVDRLLPKLQFVYDI